MAGPTLDVRDSRNDFKQMTAVWMGQSHVVMVGAFPTQFGTAALLAEGRDRTRSEKYLYASSIFERTLINWKREAETGSVTFVFITSISHQQLTRAY
jgi:hypothetical protein